LKLLKGTEYSMSNFSYHDHPISLRDCLNDPEGTMAVLKSVGSEIIPYYD